MARGMRLSARRLIVPAILSIATWRSMVVSAAEGEVPGKNYVQRMMEDSLINCEFEMIAIPGGDFSLQERKVDPKDATKIICHEKSYRVTLSPYWIGKQEVTWGLARAWAWPAPNFAAKFRDLSANSQRAYLACPMFLGMSPEVANHNENPFTSLSHFGAKRFCHWLSLMTGKFYRLPTEAEWEYACRAGSAAAFPWGEDPEPLPSVTAAVLRREDLRVGACEANPWGVYDMLGNVEEWVADGYHEGYKSFGDAHELHDPIAWPLGSLERQAEPMPLPAGEFLPPPAESRWTGLIGDWWEGTRHRLTNAELESLRDRSKARGDFVSWEPGVARGGSDQLAVSPTARHFGFALRYQPMRNADTAPATPYDHNSIFWNNGPMPFDIGFRVVRPVKVPSAEEQLWHWGIYENHEFWTRYTIPPND